MRATTATPSSPDTALPVSVSLAAESVLLSLAAFAAVQLGLWAGFGFDVVGEAFGTDAAAADAVKVLLGLAAFAVVLRHVVRPAHH